MVAQSISDLIGKTPLCRLNKLCPDFNVYAKLEYFNPAGSTKDRAALFMLNDAEKRGIIKAGATIVEPTSGNTGIGLAAIGVSRGYKVILTMPDTMSKERIALLSAYGAEVVLTDGSLGMTGAIEKANELKERLNAFIVSQFDNPSNPLSHYTTTGREIYEDMDGKVDIFVCGVGTGGTISGIGRFLKEKCPSVKIIAYEPESSSVLSGGKAGKHGIQGIGANFVPQNFDRSVCDEIVTVSDDEAYKYASLIAKTEGFLCGISSGGAYCAALKIASRKENEGKNIVVLFPDGGERYLSLGIYN